MCLEDLQTGRTFDQVRVVWICGSWSIDARQSNVMSQVVIFSQLERYISPLGLQGGERRNAGIPRV